MLELDEDADVELELETVVVPLPYGGPARDVVNVQVDLEELDSYEDVG